MNANDGLIPPRRRRWPWALLGLLTLFGGFIAMLVPAVRRSREAAFLAQFT